MHRVNFRAAAVFALLGGLAAAQAPAWLEVNTPHFHVVSDAAPAAVAHVASQLESLRALVRQQMPALQNDPPLPIQVLAVAKGSEFTALEPAAYQGKLGLVGYFERGRERNYILMRLDAVNEIHPYAFIYHDYLRLLAAQRGGLPVWLVEGLAEFFETAEVNGATATLGEAAPYTQARLRAGTLLPLATLFQADAASPFAGEQDQASMFYPEVWALTHYLLLRDQGQGTHHVADYLALTGEQHLASADAAARAFGDLSQLQQTLAAYARQASFTTMHLTLADAQHGLYAPLNLATPEAEAMKADFLAHFQRYADATALLKPLLAQTPPSATALEAMGYIAEQQQRTGEAAQWYGKAADAAPQDFWTQYLYANQSLRLSAGPLDTATAAHVKTSLESALRLRPEFAPAMNTLATFDSRQGQDLDAALQLERSAIAHDPSNLNYQLNLANLLVATRKPGDAIALLEKLQTAATDPAQRADLASRLQSARQYEASLAAAVQRTSPPMPAGSQMIEGTVQKVRCAVEDPALITPSFFTMAVDLSVAGARMTLRSRDYRQVAFSAANFDPPANFNPCTGLNGLNVNVTVRDGQIQSIVMSRASSGKN